MEVKVNKHLEGSCELLCLNLILMLTSLMNKSLKISSQFVQDELETVCKLQILCNQCSIFVQSVSKNTDKNTSCCTSRVAFKAKTDMPSSLLIWVCYGLPECLNTPDLL